MSNPINTGKLKWYDQRAKEGEWWTVVSDTFLISWSSYRPTFNYWYRSVRWKHANKDERQKYGPMAKKEAKAMAKLLNASEEGR